MTHLSYDLDPTYRRTSNGLNPLGDSRVLRPFFNQPLVLTEPERNAPGHYHLGRVSRLLETTVRRRRPWKRYMQKSILYRYLTNDIWFASFMFSIIMSLFISLSFFFLLFFLFLLLFT